MIFCHPLFIKVVQPEPVFGNIDIAFAIGQYAGMSLPENATLADLSLPRREADRFIRKALGNLIAQQRQTPDARLRLGRTGTGQAPNYRIETPQGDPVSAFNGANHEEWPEGESFAGQGTWSLVTMTREDVQAALAAVA